MSLRRCTYIAAIAALVTYTVATILLVRDLH